MKYVIEWLRLEFENYPVESCAALVAIVLAIVVLITM